MAINRKTGIDHTTPQPVKEKTREEIRKQIMEIFHQGQHYSSPRCIYVTCTCGNRVAFFAAYRCWFCKIWFCKDCAGKHFVTEEGNNL
jgi:hypothetical protein